MVLHGEFEESGLVPEALQSAGCSMYLESPFTDERLVDICCRLTGTTPRSTPSPRGSLGDSLEAEEVRDALTQFEEAIDSVLSRVRQAVAFLGGFSALAGVIVLIGALATSRISGCARGRCSRRSGRVVGR